MIIDIHYNNHIMTSVVLVCLHCILIFISVKTFGGASVTRAGGVDVDNTAEPGEQTSEHTFVLVTSPDQIQGKDGVEISFSGKNFTEIGGHNNILRVITDPSNISLSCHSTRDRQSKVWWRYNGSELYSDNQVSLKYVNNDARLITVDLRNGPPVARMECLLRSNTSVQNNILIYKGENTSPLLYKNQETVNSTVVNGTLVIFPCLLKYPVDFMKDKALQLLKNEEVVEDKYDLKYVPEQGYYLNLPTVEQHREALGSYKCKVLNSTDDDYVLINFNTETFIQLKYLGSSYLFYEKHPGRQKFQCSASKAFFNGEFQWFYKMRDGSHMKIEPKLSKNGKKGRTQSTTTTEFIDTFWITFDTAEITHVICASQLNNSEKFLNSSVKVDVLPSYPPVILNKPDSNQIVYEKDLNLTCLAYGTNVQFEWLKNGEPVIGDITEEKSSNSSSSTFSVHPLFEDSFSHYTCCASNFLSTNSCYTFFLRTQSFPDPDPNSIVKERQWLVNLLAILLGTIVILLGGLFTFFKPRCKPRTFPLKFIREFYQGYKPLGTEHDFYSVAFDRSTIVKKEDIMFDKTREGKSGNFATVDFGWLKKADGSLIPVAIKSIKNNENASDEEMNSEFQKFLREIKLWSIIGDHENVVKYIGAMTDELEKYSAYLLLEDCNKGDILSYIATHRNSFDDDVGNQHRNSSNSDFKLKTSHLMKWSEQIAAGLEHISEKNIIHRDLAARNVVLQYDGIIQEGIEPHPGLLTAKICDFGLSKDLNEQQKAYYQIVNSQMLPVRWVAPEALRTLKFTTKNDVWALGVVMWEMFTLGELPYNNLHLTDRTCQRTLLDYFDGGNSLPQPMFAPRVIWEIIESCLSKDPSERPTFIEIKEKLHEVNEAFVNQTQISTVSEPAPSRPEGYCSIGNSGFIEFSNEGCKISDFSVEHDSEIGPKRSIISENVQLNQTNPNWSTDVRFYENTGWEGVSDEENSDM